MGKRLMEDCLTLDLAWLMRLAPIREGEAGTGEIKWTVDGDLIGALRFQLDLRTIGTAGLILHYNLAATQSQRKPTRQVIKLTALAQYFGGHRWWMRCPMTGEKVRIVYLSPGADRFAGRKALGLAYRVERLNRFDRPFEKLFRAQQRLGNSQGLGTGLARPKGMWHRNFAVHAKRFEALDFNCAKTIFAMIERA